MPEYRKRLLAMGLTRGTRITVRKRAPFGDPVELFVRGFRLSLRRSEAEVLLLEAATEQVAPAQSGPEQAAGASQAAGKGGCCCGR